LPGFNFNLEEWDAEGQNSLQQTQERSPAIAEKPAGPFMIRSRTRVAGRNRERGAAQGECLSADVLPVLKFIVTTRFCQVLGRSDNVSIRALPVLTPATRSCSMMAGGVAVPRAIMDISARALTERPRSWPNRSPTIRIQGRPNLDLI
jgi:hypothetical protein